MRCLLRSIMFSPVPDIRRSAMESHLARCPHVGEIGAQRAPEEVERAFGCDKENAERKQAEYAANYRHRAHPLVGKPRSVGQFAKHGAAMRQKPETFH